MKSRKLTMLNIYTGCGSPNETVFLWVNYIDDQVDFVNAREEVQRVRPGWRPLLGDYIPSCRVKISLDKLHQSVNYPIQGTYSNVSTPRK